MTAADARWHRTQRDPTQASRNSACLIASTLSVMAAVTRGRVGPGISLDAFRLRQLDRAGGIDLFDAKYAARTFGVRLEVHANFGPGAEYPEPVRESLMGHGATTPAAAIAMLEDNRFLTLSLLYSALPRDCRHDATYQGPHGVALLGHRVRMGRDELLVSDPLSASAHWHPAAPFWTAASAFSRAPGRLCLAATDARVPLRRVRVLPGLCWIYSRPASGPVTRRRGLTGGFSADCESPASVQFDGASRQLVRITTGAYAGTLVDPAAWNVRITEVP